MKVAISSNDKTIESNVSDIFGRCLCFIIAEVDDDKIGKIQVIENKNTDQISGAGISTAKLLVENDVEAVITGQVGPRAMEVLKQFNIEVYTGSGIIKDVLQEFIEGKLKKIQ